MCVCGGGVHGCVWVLCECECVCVWGVLCMFAGGRGMGGGKESPCYCDFFDIVHIFNIFYCTTLCIVVYLYNICELLFSFQNEMVNVLKISHHQAVRMGRGSTV